MLLNNNTKNRSSITHKGDKKGFHIQPPPKKNKKNNYNNNRTQSYVEIITWKFTYTSSNNERKKYK